MLFLVAAGGAGWLTLAQGAEAPASGPAALYQEYCAVCHGDRGDGRSRARAGLIPPPRDFTAPGLANTLTRERMIDAVLHGRPGTAMTAWRTRLTPQQAASVVEFIRDTFMVPGSSSTPSTPAKPAPDAGYMAQAMPHDLRGEPHAGELFYRENCATCHGLDGSGNGPRAYFIFPKPRNFLSPAARRTLNRPALFRGIKDGVAGREMPAWGKVLSDQQIADVAEYVFARFIRAEVTAPRSP